MFLSESERAAADRYHALLECERALGEWEWVLAKRHPETLTVADLNQMRADLLRHIAAIRKLILSTAEAM